MAATSRLTGQLDNRVGHIALIGHGERLGLKSEGLRQLNPLVCDAVGVSPRRVVNLRRGCGIHRFGPHPVGSAVIALASYAKTGLPHRHHQCPAGAEELGGFTDSPTRRVRAVVTDEDRRSRSHPCERLGARNLKTRWHDIG